MTSASRVLIACAVLLTSVTFAAEPGAVPENKKSAPKDDPSLPRLLIIGDSISMGYTPFVAESMKGKANVHHNAGNAGPTSHGIEQIDAWLGDGKWAVIHFNFGLHDLKTTTGDKEDKPYPDVHQVTPEQYEKNLREIVAKMKKTGAKLIWATTTPVPEGSLKPARKVEDAILYNKVAAKVMEENGIPTDDLYAAAKSHQDKIQLKKGNVHFNATGYKLLAEQVVKSIQAAQQ